ncbi:helix-turn-helix transcriptional regulator [Actinomadura rayongensis]|uniref:Helix-turn-helix domain-containing protein n=1 Tax=Actinomadura rayongensis TaxID=1429076 RepID=A0A6I4WB72_9ACTN|nr:helix-turn-helix transcriptional regulator [Actinomadura rayongensis]MXQ65525.1 helix-turn-helix domain-containing protein [Actinomadura rayongensis]
MPGPGNVGERVRNLRLTRRLSQAQLAGHDLSDSYISLIESGKRTPTPTVLRMLAERLGCTPEYLAEGVEPEQRAHLEVRERHAHLTLLAGDAAAAEAAFEDVLDRSDDADLVARARWGRARALEELGRVEEAIALFEDLREQADRDPGRSSRLPAVIALARCYHAVGDLGQAIALAERALDRLTELGLTVGAERAEAGRVLLTGYLDRADVVRAHALGRRLLAPPAEVMPLCAHYRQASTRALDEGAIGDALYFADQALATRGGEEAERAEARLRLAAARALLRGVPPFTDAATPEPLDPAAPRAVPSAAAARAALDLLAGTDALVGGEAAEATIERARGLVLAGDVGAAIAALEEFLDTGFALAAPESTATRPDGAPSARTRTTVQARLVLARARVAQRDGAAALVVLRAAAGQLATLPPGRPAAHLARELGELFEAAGDRPAAADAYRRALEATGLRATRPVPAGADLPRV